MNFQQAAVVFIVICVVNLLVGGYYAVTSESKATRGFMAGYTGLSVYGMGMAIGTLGGGA